MKDFILSGFKFYLNCIFYILAVSTLPIFYPQHFFVIILHETSELNMHLLSTDTTLKKSVEENTGPSYQIYIYSEDIRTYIRTQLQSQKMENEK